MQTRFPRGGLATHRHDTYAVCVTDVGPLSLDYRGRTETSLAGQVIVLHPDEPHDGRSVEAGGFGYRIVYVDPAVIVEAVRAIHGSPGRLPFVSEPVGQYSRLARAVSAAFDSPPEPLALDAVVLQLTEGLLAAAGVPPPDLASSTRRHIDLSALERVRAFIRSRPTTVHSHEIESLAGLSRYEVARQFRAVYGTSPYRYSLSRRLEVALGYLRLGLPLAQVALAAGFFDQAHFTRQFRDAFGMTPGQYRRLQGTTT
jgi:AraC-like DNA-binding protein